MPHTLSHPLTCNVMLVSLTRQRPMRSLPLKKSLSYIDTWGSGEGGSEVQVVTRESLSKETRLDVQSIAHAHVSR